jgi:hypothetical protein
LDSNSSRYSIPGGRRTNDNPALLFIIRNETGIDKIVVIDHTVYGEIPPIKKWKRKIRANIVLTTYTENDYRYLMNETRFPVLFGEWW